MLLPRIFAPIRAAAKASTPSASSLIPSSHVLNALRAANASTPSPTLSFIRNATSLSQGRANGAKDGPGKRLGAKKSGGEKVVPGNIIFRQRGVSWYPGENCGIGRDHCIFAKQPGYVRYYRDPRIHPDRQYIGVVFEKDDTLPYPSNSARKRRLGMVPVKIEPEQQIQPVQTEIQTSGMAEGDTEVSTTPPSASAPRFVMGKNYLFREANWEIGRAAEKAGVKVREFVPGDRFRAWRKRKARHERSAEKRRMRASTKKKQKRK